MAESKKSPKNNRPFTAIYDDFPDDLSLSNLVAYAVIYRFCMMKKGECTASNETLAKTAHMSKRQFIRCKHELEKLGYITDIQGLYDTSTHTIQIRTSDKMSYDKMSYDKVSLCQDVMPLVTGCHASSDKSVKTSDRMSPKDTKDTIKDTIKDTEISQEISLSEDAYNDNNISEDEVSINAEITEFADAPSDPTPHSDDPPPLEEDWAKEWAFSDTNLSKEDVDYGHNFDLEDWVAEQ